MVAVWSSSIRRIVSRSKRARSWIRCWIDWVSASPARPPPLRGWPMSEIAILGAGAWGTALAIQASRAGNEVVLWARNGADAIAASRISPRLPGHRLPENILVTDAVPKPDGLVVVAVPTQALRPVLVALPPVPELLICA